MWLQDGKHTVGCEKSDFGVSLAREHDRKVLYTELKKMIDRLLQRHSIVQEQIEYLVASGMAGSEWGLYDLPHIPLKANLYHLVKHLRKMQISEIGSFPIILVPGLKKMVGETIADIMRGEETETYGILQKLHINENLLLVLPGTHNKIILINSQETIEDFITTTSGELLDCLIKHSILSGHVSHNFDIVPDQILYGAAYAKENGLGAAIFHIRAMQKNGINSNACSSFLYGSVLEQDAALIRRMAGGRRVFIGGRETIRRVLCLLLKGMAEEIDSQVCDNAVKNGLITISQLYKAYNSRPMVIDRIAAERLIAIVRKPERSTVIPAVEALYRGGVRLIEVTFDHSGSYGNEYTAEIIRLLCERFSGRMLIGAGTVLNRDEVVTAYEAGAAFILSPDCNSDVISLTKELGLVSIPGAFSPSDIAAARRLGADFIKLFPANQLGKNYLKAVTAPLADVRLMAVGGVTVENVRDMLDLGFCGVGVGSELYNKNIIAKEAWDELASLARKFTDAVKNK